MQRASSSLFLLLSSSSLLALVDRSRLDRRHLFWVSLTLYYRASLLTNKSLLRRCERIREGEPARVTDRNFRRTRASLARDVASSPSRQRLPIAFRCPRSRPRRVAHHPLSPQERCASHRRPERKSEGRERRGEREIRDLSIFTKRIPNLRNCDIRILRKFHDHAFNRYARDRYLFSPLFPQKIAANFGEKGACAQLLSSSLPPLPFLLLSLLLAIGTSANGRVLTRHQTLAIYYVP